MRSNTGQILYIPRVGQRANLQHPLMKGCMGWWPLTDGAGGIAKDLMRRNDGTLAGQSGGLPTWKTSVLGATIESNGTQERRVEITNDFMLSRSAMSVNLWCYFDSSVGYNVNFAYGGLSYGFMMRTLTGGNHVYQFVTIGLAGNTDLRTNTNAFSDGQWHMFTCTYNGSVKKTYIDGVEAASASATGTIAAPAYDTDILTAQGSGWSVEGRMQNVRAWNRGLSGSEVLQLYTNPWAGLSIPSSTRYFFVPQPQQIFPPRMKLKTSINVSKGGRIVI